MANDQQQGQEQQQEQQQHEQQEQAAQQPQTAQAPATGHQTDDVDGLADKKPEELTPDELRLMADTMPGEGPGD